MSTYDEYEYDSDFDPNYDYGWHCDKCVYELTDGSRYCKNCGLEDNLYEELHDETMYDKKTIKFKYQHDASKYNAEQLSKLKGIINEKELEVADSLLIKILKEIPNPFTWKDVFEAYKKYYSSDLWLSFGHVTEIFDMDITRWTLQEWNSVCLVSNELKEISKEYKWEDSSKISIWYLFKKIQELKNKDTSWIPIKASKSIIKKYEKKWEDCCDWFGLEFKPIKPYEYISTTKTGKDRKIKELNIIPPVKWEKNKIIKIFEKNLNDKINTLMKTQKQMDEIKNKYWWRISNQI